MTALNDLRTPAAKSIHGPKLSHVWNWLKDAIIAKSWASHVCSWIALEVSLSPRQTMMQLLNEGKKEEVSQTGKRQREVLLLNIVLAGNTMCSRCRSRMDRGWDKER